MRPEPAMLPRLAGCHEKFGPVTCLNERTAFSPEAMKTIPDFAALDCALAESICRLPFDSGEHSHYSTRICSLRGARLEPAKLPNGPFIHARALSVLLSRRCCARVFSGLEFKAGFDGLLRTRRAKKRCGFSLFAPAILRIHSHSLKSKFRRARGASICTPHHRLSTE